MTNKLVVGCVQNCASADLAASLEEVTELCREGAAQGANLLCMPEYVSCFALTDAGFEVAVGPEDGHPALAHFRALARELEVWMVVGTLAIEHLDAKIPNRSYLLDPGGAVVSIYDKIHLFDVDLPNGESYRESEIISPGDRAVVAGTPWGPIGLTICYDLRFPHLYRELAKAGALFLTVPAAFTKTTGQAHWLTLVRSRANRNGRVPHRTESIRRAWQSRDVRPFARRRPLGRDPGRWGRRFQRRPRHPRSIRGTHCARAHSPR